MTTYFVEPIGNGRWQVYSVVEKNGRRYRNSCGEFDSMKDATIAKEKMKRLEA